MGNPCPKCLTDNSDTARFCVDCGTGLSPLQDGPPDFTKTMETPKQELTTGSTFAERYQIIEELGKGGMGRVYKALDKETHEKIALKLIAPEIASDKKTIERFRNELTTARKIAHRNVCRMFDLNREQENYYITMEYVSGGDLKKFIRRSKQLSVGTALGLARQILEGLAEAHRQGIVHRDLKPNNIMIDDDGNARIMDFGIARIVKGKGITGSGVIIGTPEYMSPEQAEAKEIDHRSDIYSLGVILFEMVTGQLPFEGDTPLSIAMKHKGEAPKKPKEINPQIPDGLSNLILKCLEKNKQDRYQDTKEIESELEKVEQGLPTTDRVFQKKKPITSREITVQFSLRKIGFPVLITLAIAVVGLMIWSPWNRKTSAPVLNDKPSLAVMYFENNTGDPSLDHWRKALSDLLITDLSQSRHLRILSGEELFHVLKEMNREDASVYSWADLEGVTREGGIEHVVVGKLVKAGETFRIDAQIQKPQTREVVVSERVEGVGEDSLFTMVDALTRKIKAALNFSERTIADDIDQDVTNITTGSKEALKYYIEGRKLHDAGKYRESIEIMEKAVSLDPEFATAYRSLAVAWWNLGYTAEARKYDLKAFENKHKVSERERLRIEAQYYQSSSQSNWDKAIATYEKLLEIYPDESSSSTNLIVLQFMLERWDQAWARVEKHIDKPESFYPYFWRGQLLMIREQYEEAAQVLEHYLDVYHDHPMIRLALSIVFLSQNRFDAALQEIDKALAIVADPTVLNFKGDILLCRGQWEKAEIEYSRLLEMEEKIGPVWGHQSLGALHLYKGKFGAAATHFKRAGELASELNDDEESAESRLLQVYTFIRMGKIVKARNICEEEQKKAAQSGSFFRQTTAAYMKGLSYIHQGDIRETERSIQELTGIVERGLVPKLIRYVFHLRGLVELENKNFSPAADYFRKATALMPGESGWPDDRALFIYSLGRVYWEAGELGQAQKQFEEILGLTSGRIYFGDVYAKSLFKLGDIFERRNMKSQAVEYYEKFLELWKDADPGILEIEDAKERLMRLRM